MKLNLMLVSLIIVSSCASRNFHAENYVANINISQIPKPDVVSEGSDPLIISTKNLNQDYETLLSKGYILLGYSSFEGELDEQYNVIQQGRDTGATVILTTNAFLGVSSSTIPLLLPTSSTTYSSGSYKGTGNTNYSNSYGRHLGQSNSNYNGTFSGQTTTQSNQWVPMTVSKTIYRQTTAFFVKTNQDFKLGLYFRDLNQDERRVIEKNTGIMVTTVIENTPAFYKNIVPGDAITSINDIEIVNNAHAGSIINSNQKIETIKVVRNGKEILIPMIEKVPATREISSIEKLKKK